MKYDVTLVYLNSLQDLRRSSFIPPAMNASFKKLNKTLKVEFLKAFQSGSNTDIFNLLYLYMQFIEDDNENFLHSFILGNPLEENKKDEITEDFNKKSLDFLKSVMKNHKAAHPYDSTVSEAQVYMGLAYEFGLFGLKKNSALATSYYSSAARQNHPIGTFRMGQCFEKGIGKPKNHRHAIDFYRCSAKLGYVVGMHIYGSILLHGDLNNKKELQSGLFYLKLASRKADMNYPFPYYDLAQVYESGIGIGEIEPDDDYAFRIYFRGANLNCPNCQYRIARCYEFGELNQERDQAVAIAWYKKASELGQIDAQIEYSKFLFTGIDGILQPNTEQSFFWALRAAVRGHPQAAFCIAELVENGCGTKKSVFLALWWYTVSYEFGNTQARDKLRTLKHHIDMKNEGTREFKCCGCF